MWRGECEDNVRGDDVETTRISKDIYIGSSVVLQTQLRSGLYNSFLTRTPGSEGVRNRYAWKRWALIGFVGPDFKQPMFGGSYFCASPLRPNNWTPCWNSARAAIRR